MRISDAFAKNYLRAEDFDTDGRVLIITSVEMETVGREQKLVAYLKDEDKAFPLNKTNAESIAELYGDDTDDWSNCAILVRQEMTQFENKRVPCMRVVNKKYAEQDDGTFEPVKSDKQPASSSGKSGRGRKAAPADDVTF